MKKMWKLNNKAVSPVIATILMVAITVVLAAVLYVMVMGFGGETTQAPTVSLNPNGDRLVISISDPQKFATPMALQLLVGGVKYNFTAAGFSPTGPTGLVYTDAGADGKVSTGDYLSRSSGTAVPVKIVWTSGGTTQILAEGEI